MKNVTNSFKEAFENALRIYDRLADGDEVSDKDQEQAITQLRTAYDEFCKKLYDVLSMYDSWDDQNNVFEDIRADINNERLFSDEFRRDTSASLNCFKIFGAIKNVCWWFTDDRYRLRSFCYQYRKNHPDLNEVTQSAPIDQANQEPKGKGELKAQRIALFYNILKRLGVTKSMAATDIAWVAEFITGGKIIARRDKVKNTYASKHLCDKLNTEVSALLDRCFPKEQE